MGATFRPRCRSINDICSGVSVATSAASADGSILTGCVGGGGIVEADEGIEFIAAAPVRPGISPSGWTLGITSRGAAIPGAGAYGRICEEDITLAVGIVGTGGGVDARSFPLFRTNMPSRIFDVLSFGRCTLSRSSMYSGIGASLSKGMI